MALLDFLTSKFPKELGVRDGKLSPCNPDKSNCVCSQYKASSHNMGPHYVQPFGYEGNAGDAMTRIVAVLLQQTNCTIVTSRPDYIHAMFRGETLGFVDDVEFLLVAAEQVIHVRSASRLGISDLGLNRSRVKELREAYDEADDDESTPRFGE